MQDTIVKDKKISSKIFETTNGQEYLEVLGARVHNLKNIDVKIPRNKLVVITGISGSGKSSLAFDTIYAEGQRRYMESFSAYARQFLGTMERPDVDYISGLSPVISIEQKTTSRRPRSTVGTVTEIYDFLRLLFARAGEAYSYVTGEKMVKQSDDQIVNSVLKNHVGKKILILTPVVKGRKGHYRELFEQIRKQGFLRVRMDGEIQELVPKMQVDRYKVHDIEVVIDKALIKKENRHRIYESVKKALDMGKGSMLIMEDENSPLTKGESPDKVGIRGLSFFSRKLMCPTSGISYDEPAPNSFSFNSPYGMCRNCSGLGYIYTVDEDAIFPDKNLSISQGGIAPLGELRDIWMFDVLAQIGKKYKFSLSTPIKNISPEAMKMILYGSGEEKISVKRDEYGMERNYEFNFEGIKNFIRYQYETSSSENIADWAVKFMRNETCPECNGARLKKESLYFRLVDKNIFELCSMDIIVLKNWFETVYEKLNMRQNEIAREIIKEIKKRLQFLLDVGLEYLALDRPAGSLSGGEAQRIRLATQIGSQLTGVLYILDEPSIGLHQRDNQKLIRALKDLRDVGNSVIVVEHDKEMIQQADYVIDIGPGAGIHGGKIVAQGTPEKFLSEDSLTSKYIHHIENIPVPKQRRVRMDSYGEGIRELIGTSEKFLILEGVKGNNLKNITVKFPLGKFICVTGVSGSGKSSLINETLYPILAANFYHAYRQAGNSKINPLPYSSIGGMERVDKVIEIDQSPIGRTPRSNPATYTGVFSPIRDLFAELPEAKIRGYKSGRFSFNVKSGRCEMCMGGGMRLIEMNFLPDVYVQCETCKGMRYNRETLEVRFKGKSINDVLNMTVEEALTFFDAQPRILKTIQTLYEVGLGYITLGQQATTLSGGEAQRVKLATELAKRDTGNTFYILDEPTTGLHFSDIKMLLDVLQKLVDKGNTVLVIEHNMDVIKVADWIIDLGPDGGERGGKIVAEGTPEEIARTEGNYTGEFLKKELN